MDGWQRPKDKDKELEMVDHVDQDLEFQSAFVLYSIFMPLKSDLTTCLPFALLCSVPCCCCWTWTNSRETQREFDAAHFSFVFFATATCTKKEEACAPGFTILLLFVCLF